MRTKRSRGASVLAAVLASACAGGEQHDVDDERGTLGEDTRGDTLDSVTGVVAITTTGDDRSSSIGDDGETSSGDGECIPATLRLRGAPTSNASRSSDSREHLRAPLKEDACSVTAMSWHDVVVAR